MSASRGHLLHARRGLAPRGGRQACHGSYQRLYARHGLAPRDEGEAVTIVINGFAVKALITVTICSLSSRREITFCGKRLTTRRWVPVGGSSYASLRQKGGPTHTPTSYTKPRLDYRYVIAGDVSSRCYLPIADPNSATAVVPLYCRHVPG